MTESTSVEYCRHSAKLGNGRTAAYSDGLAAAALLALSIFGCVGCDGNASSKISSQVESNVSARPNPTETDDLVCRRGDGETNLADFGSNSWQSLTSVASETTPFRCLRFLEDAERRGHDGSMTIVDIRRNLVDGKSDGSGLRIPLYEIKTKAFLRNRQLAILSDGKRFGELEKECNDIKASGVDDVFAILQVPPKQLSGENQGPLPVTTILTREFIAERGFGVWHIVNLTSEDNLIPPIFQFDDVGHVDLKKSARKSSMVGLERTLFIFDDTRSQNHEGVVQRYRVSGQAFVLKGGIEGFRRYESKATAMALALAQPRIHERGCAG